MEDVRVGRRTKTREIVVATGAAFAEVVNANPDRKTLTISPPQTNAIRLCFGAARTDGNGFVMPTGGHPLTLTVETHGEIVFGPIFAASPAGADVFFAWETRLEEK